MFGEYLHRDGGLRSIGLTSTGEILQIGEGTNVNRRAKRRQNFSLIGGDKGQ